ncbi:MAG TPA: hypothetical protein VMT66_07395 [Steroidobacteraceae bacterium]|nr:hypothetical protein [Steroidobacteraceae bacterium]
MRAMTWAIFGSLAINLVLGLAIAAVFTAAPRASAAAATRCSTQQAKPAPSAAAPRPAAAHRYIVAVRMGWAS